MAHTIYTLLDDFVRDIMRCMSTHMRPPLDSPPRVVSPALIRYLSFSGSMIRGGWMWLAISSVCAWVFLSDFDWHGWDRYQGPWNEVSGRVVRVFNTGWCYGDEPSIHRIEFTFKIAAQEYHEHCYTYGTPKFSVGSEQLVRMLPGKPASARVDGTRKARTDIGYECFSILPFLLIGFWILSHHIGAGRRQAELLANGILTEGRIIEHIRINGVTRQDDYYHVTVAYDDTDGCQQEKLLIVYELLSAKEPVYMLYLPGKPESAVRFEPDDRTKPYTISRSGAIIPHAKTNSLFIFLFPLLFLVLQVLCYYKFVVQMP